MISFSQRGGIELTHSESLDAINNNNIQSVKHPSKRWLPTPLIDFLSSAEAC